MRCWPSTNGSSRSIPKRRRSMSGATTRRRSRHPPWRRARPRGRCRAAGGSAGVTRSRAGCDYAQLGDHRGLSWAEGRPKEGCLSLGAARRDRDHRRLAGAGPPRYRQQVAGPTRRVRPRAPLGDGQRPLRRHSAGGGGASRRRGVAPATRLSVSYSLPPVAVALGRRALDIACATLATRVSRGVTKVAESEVVQTAVGEAAAAIDVATMLLHTGRDYSTAEVSSGRRITEAEALRARRDMVYAQHQVGWALDRLCEMDGARWVYDNDRLGAIRRDVMTILTHHAASRQAAMTPYGRMLLAQGDV